MRIDLHAHSEASRRPSIWVLQKIGCAESYTDAEELYQTMKRRGMTAVTITDHNTIEGCLRISHLPDTFISAEVTTYFPEDGCKLHVLVYDVTEAQFREIDRARESVFDLVAYLSVEGIRHSLAHPFFPVNGRLTPEHFDRLVLLFRTFELNGDQEESSNVVLREILSSLDPGTMDELADRCGIEPLHEQPWRKGLTGGSDDHSGLDLGRTYTAVEGASSLGDFFAGVDAGNAEIVFRRVASPERMAHHIYSVAYRFYRQRFDIGAAEGTLLVRFLDRVLLGRESEQTRGNSLRRIYSGWRQRFGPSRERRPGPSIMATFQEHASRHIEQDRDLCQVLLQRHPVVQEPERKWLHFVTQVSNTMLEDLSENVVRHLFSGNLFDVFHAIGSGGALYTLTAPYFISYSVYNTARAFGAGMRGRYAGGARAGTEPGVGIFTDTLDEVNGVALTLREQADLACRSRKRLTVVSCADRSRARSAPPGIRYFEPITVQDCPEYPDQKIFMPPILKMMEFCYREGFTHIHAATPGPVGLAALAIARILKLPFYTTYHTSVPQYTLRLTGDGGMEDFMWRYILWFYHQSDLVFAPSLFTAQELAGRGIPEEKIRIMPRGVDVSRFRKRPPAGGIDLPQGRKILYAGRISKEKNLSLLGEALRRMCDAGEPISLVVAGDGPYLEEMRAQMQGYPCRFTGLLEGEDLVDVYNACDLFVFPSTTDTFGNVVLEAQACGLPVVVTDIGGPLESIFHGETGLVVKGDDVEALIDGIGIILHDDDLRAGMSRKAREFVEGRTFESAFEEYWRFYLQPPVCSPPAAGEGDRLDPAAQAI